MRGALDGTGANVSVYRGVLLAALALLAVVIAAGCGVDLDALQGGLDAGPRPPARPGAYVWVCGGPDLIVGSADGGATWEVRNRRPDGDIMTGDLWAIAFADVGHGWAVRRGIANPTAAVLATADAGESWSWQKPGTRGGRLLAVAATDTTHVWAVGYQRLQGNGEQDRGLVLASTDGGATWTRQRLPAGLSPFRVAFADARHGWLLAVRSDHGSGYHVLSTSDGGAHWRVSYSTQLKLTGLDAVGAKECWAVGAVDHPQSGVVIRTSDGGGRWQLQKDVSTGQLLDVSFPDARHGWAVGLAGTVVATSDGGATWSAQDPGGDFALKQVSFSDPQHGWARIGLQALLATTDGGQSWSVVRPTDEREVLTGLATVDSASVAGQ
jgi:photosystem II stability/assembly factor-like uncharacterized protein